MASWIGDGKRRCGWHERMCGKGEELNSRKIAGYSEVWRGWWRTKSSSHTITLPSFLSDSYHAEIPGSGGGASWKQFMTCFWSLDLDTYHFMISITPPMQVSIKYLRPRLWPSLCWLVANRNASFYLAWVRHRGVLQKQLAWNIMMTPLWNLLLLVEWRLVKYGIFIIILKSQCYYRRSLRSNLTRKGDL